MMDGVNVTTKTPSEFDLQNRDYNGWTSSVNRNVVIIWDTFGRVVDAAVNTPRSFHDSSTCRWGRIYDQIAKLPEGFVVVCDSAFTTNGHLEGKLVKVKGIRNATTSKMIMLLP